MNHNSFHRGSEHGERSDRRDRDFSRRDRNSNTHEHRSHDDAEWFDAVCSECHESFRVPFEPDPDRSILCKSCLRASRENNRYDRDRSYDHSRRDRFNDRDRRPREEQKPQELFDIVCSHCGKQDQVPFRPYEGSVVLCRECMENPNVERVGGKIYHTIICSICGKENRVPFKPDPGSRVLCRECHAAEREEKQRSREYFAKHHPSVVHNTKVKIDIRCEKCGCIDSLPFVPKTHGPLLCRQCAENTFGDEWARRNRLGAHEYPFTCARCAAQDFVPFKPKEGQEILCKHCLNDQAVLKHHDTKAKRHDAFTCVRHNSNNDET